tara:strand:+ start:3624 stop:3923 length:300 start_codon:yes stop_codon:yes gene_type:complete
MRYTIAEENLGFFLGAFKNQGVFAKTDVFGLSKAISFSTKEEAEEFIDDHMYKAKEEWLVIGIETDSKFVHVVDLLKNGYHQYTHNMVDSIEMSSTEIH